MAVAPKWYFTEEEIEKHSPSRKDGISFKEESHFRHLYCSYLQELGMELRLPQTTIAGAMVLCHRFYMLQSHAKNSWQTIAAACVFLASKFEETPCFLRDVVFAAYILFYKRDPLSEQRIRHRELYKQHKETLLLGERLVLATTGFLLYIDLPYAPLVAAVKVLGMSHTQVVRVAWNYMNDWVRTTFCLRYKPHYIAAGSLYLAAKRLKLKLASSGNAWWMQFEVSPKILDGVIKHMVRFEEWNRRRKVAQPVCNADHQSTQQIVVESNGSADHQLTLQIVVESNGSADHQSTQQIVVEDGTKKVEASHILVYSSNSGVEDEDGGQNIGQSVHKTSGQSEHKTSGFKRAPGYANHINIDIHGIRERIKKRKLKKAAENMVDPEALEITQIGGDLDEAWMERELESGVEK